MMNDYGLTNKMSLTADSEHAQLQEILQEHLRLEQEKDHYHASPEKKKEIQKKIDELVRQRDHIIFGGWK